MEEQQSLMKVNEEVKQMEETVAAAPAPAIPDANYLENPQQFEHLQRIAKLYCASKQMVPDQYRNSMADCFLAIQLSKECGINPVVFMQNSFPVKGRIGIEGKLAVAMINRSGVYQDGVKFDLSGSGDSRQCRAWGKLRGTEIVEEQIVTVKMAKDLGWWGKAGSFWPKMTDMMLIYRSGAYLARSYHPEILLGLDLKEEIPDIEVRKSQGATNLSEKLQAKQE